MKKIFTAIFLLILITTQTFAQAWSRYKYELFYGLGATNFMGDVSAPSVDKPIWVKFWNTIGGTGNVGLRYHFNDRQYLSAQVFLGQIYAQDPAGDPNYWDRGIKINSALTTLNARYEFMIWKEKQRTTVFKKLGESSLKNFSLPTYLFIGVGGAFNVGKFSKNSSDGRYLLSEMYFNAAPEIPFGLGIKYRINSLTYFNIEAAWHATMSDGIDDANGKKNSAYGKWIDQYQTITFNMVYKIRESHSGKPILWRRR